MIRKDEAESYDVLSGKLFSSFLIINAINIFTKTVLPGAAITSYLSFILGLAFAAEYVKKRSVFKTTFAELAIIEVFFIVLVTSSILRYPQAMSLILKRCLWLFAICLPCFVVSRHVRNIDVFIARSLPATLFVTLLCVLMFLLRRTDRSTDYSMTLSYLLLFPTLMHIVQIKRKRLYLAVVSVEVFIILIYGSRGAFLAIIVFIAASIFLVEKNTVKSLVSKIILFVASATTVSIIYFNASRILLYLSSRGRLSRTLLLLLSGETISHDSGRLEIFQMIWGKILEKPFLGWGISGQASFMNTYAHNIFLDLLLENGLFLGTLISIAIISVLFCALIKNRNCKFFMVLICSGFLPLLVSGTYLQQPLFWITMGLSLSAEGRSGIRFKLGNRRWIIK